jgi:hypothetical protein
MKTNKLITLLIILTVIIVSCSKNKDSNDQKNTNPFELSKTEYKGCFTNNPVDSNKNSLYETGDSLFYTVENDTLLLHVIMNYNCCGLLNDSLVFEDENLSIYISDTCMNDCLCYCMCDFEFEYDFINFLGNNIHFYVYLKGYEENEYSLWGDLVYP